MSIHSELRPDYGAYVAKNAPLAPSRWEIDQLLVELEQIAPVRTVLEIGVFQGDSLAFWREFLNPSMLIGVDPDPKIEDDRLAFLDAHIVEGKSQDQSTFDEVCWILGDGYGANIVDFLFIDGDHTYEPMKQDWEMYSPLVRDGGIVVLHDAHIQDNDTVDTYKFLPEIQEGRFTKILWDGRDGTGLAIIYP